MVYYSGANLYFEVQNHDLKRLNLEINRLTHVAERWLFYLANSASNEHFCLSTQICMGNE